MSVLIVRWIVYSKVQLFHGLQQGVYIESPSTGWDNLGKEWKIIQKDYYSVENDLS